MASPPSDLISSTTSSAASLAPLPSTEPPKSLTTTFAPRFANSSACCFPIPPPAPVTIATLSSNLIVITYLQLSYFKKTLCILIKKKLIYYEIKIRIRFNFKNIIRIYFPNKAEV